MPITYQQEFVDKYILEARDLIQEHWEEIALNKETIKLDPDWDMYRRLEAEGSFYTFTARDNGKLVGYFAILVRPHLHYKSTRFGFNDVVFLTKEYRRGFIGTNLIKFAEKCLKEDGVDVLLINTKRHKPLDVLLSWLGYKHIENIYSKLL